MRVHRLFSGFCAAVGMLALIIDGQTAMAGAREGMELCLQTVIPSLFPFFILSIWLTGAFWGMPLPLLRSLGRYCKIPDGAESILIPAFLGGYPVGAQCVSEAFHNGGLDRDDAQRMLGFCSNAGPAFLFGMAAAVFSEPWVAWLLWAIHITSALLVSQLLPDAPQAPKRTMVIRERKHGLTAALNGAVRVMASVCGWVILFRVMIAFLSRWFLWLLPVGTQVAFSGILELSNGCCELVRIADIPFRFLICSGMLACGGLCVTMQTASVVSGLSMKWYFVGKLMQTLFSLSLSAAIVYRQWYWFPVLILLSFFLLRKEKNSSIQKPLRV